MDIRRCEGGRVLNHTSSKNGFTNIVQGAVLGEPSRADNPVRPRLLECLACRGRAEHNLQHGMRKQSASRTPLLIDIKSNVLLLGVHAKIAVGPRSPSFPTFLEVVGDVAPCSGWAYPAWAARAGEYTAIRTCDTCRSRSHQVVTIGTEQN